MTGEPYTEQECDGFRHQINSEMVTRFLATIDALRAELAEERVRRREFPEGYRFPEKWVQRAIRELHMTREEVEAKVAKCVLHHRAKGTPFKRHDLAAWNWLSERFVPNGKPTPEPKQKPYVHKVTEE